MSADVLDLYWLPLPKDFSSSFKEAQETQDLGLRLQRLRALAGRRLTLLQITKVDTALQALASQQGGTISGMPSLKLALLSSSTADHLLPSLRVAAFRRGLWLTIHLGDFNQHRQDLMNPASAVHAFKPDVMLLALDAKEVQMLLPLQATSKEVADDIQRQVDDWTTLWRLGQAGGATIIQQTIVVPPLDTLGQLDAAVPAAPSHFLRQFNEQLSIKAHANHVLLLDAETLASRVGKQTWCHWPLWYHAKQAVTPLAAPLYADAVARLLAAARGLSKKCLVLDLDNTLWGGIIGDDGLEGLELGQGSGVGEAFQAFQLYAKQLQARGVILAVCSKNDDANAKKPFESHPEMRLRLDDIAAFVANWTDKAANLKTIAQQLQIGLDALVFVDDNPAERDFVRQTLPDVEVPELPEDPAYYASCLSDAGYFESIQYTADDAARSRQYQANLERSKAQTSTHSLEEFLKTLNMQMQVSPFDDVGLPRIVQLINKSNQFNLTTRRYSEEQVRALLNDPSVLTFQIRLADGYGDNGMISVVILKPMPEDSKALRIDTWLMSCRVLGRQAEEEVLNVLVDQARKAGYSFLVGDYVPTAKNGLVRDHYKTLGFSTLSEPSVDGQTSWRLDLRQYVPRSTAIQTQVTERTFDAV